MTPYERQLEYYARQQIVNTGLSVLVFVLVISALIFWP